MDGLIITCGFEYTGRFEFIEKFDSIRLRKSTPHFVR
jgi:hypothetical protein